ncbi:23S rRNA (guanine(745)-N(1))-methyltransferase [Pantoea sp. 1.19]|uniref:23S rRNA (guanine(745)-N(1))-methyltransferase n=1 Tax=Pantoea sp. 1.19 TaxID=1925589 RepID=UPI000948BBA2|nr:23S rRNA (guanine(745)-N(1))-methyltransferase [Pantoea sp. 1.19]
MHLICPLCHLPLADSGGPLRCERGHTFDRAREGYVNLLPVQHKRSKAPGDSREMLQARRAFLQAGHYQPLQQRAVALLAQWVPAGGVLLDIGCGEGYYTDAVRAGLRAEVTGLDISKEAVRAAARRYPACQFIVASSQRLPVADASLDALLRIYAPCHPVEIARVLKPGGVVLTVTPGPRHLIEFKARIYDDVKLHDVADEQLPGLTRLSQQSLNTSLTLRGDEAVALLQMTPLAWRASPALWQALADSETFSCEADFLLTLWQKPREGAN